MTREEAIRDIEECVIPYVGGISLRMAVEALKERPHGECKTCKYYSPYREQFSYRYRGDGYCKSTITTSEGVAYINCHDNWYCANYEKKGETE